MHNLQSTIATDRTSSHVSDCRQALLINVLSVLIINHHGTQQTAVIGLLSCTPPIL